MKKIYILAIALGAFTFSTNAQIINDDMEDYSEGPLHEEHWSSWSGNAGAEDIIITTEHAFSGSQSGLIGAGGATGGPQDCLLLLGDQTTGEYDLTFKMYIPGGKTAYMNFQGQTLNGGAGNNGNGVFNSGNITFNLDGGAPGTVEDIDADGTLFNTYSYPQDFWFDVQFHFDLATVTYTLTIDGTEGAPVAFGTDAVVGAIDFFAIDPNNEFYVDDVTFGPTLGVDDFSADSFSVYPNPVKDVLNISSKASVDAITVYDILGKVVYSAQPGMISPKVNMSNFASGAYLVKVAIGNATRTIKVIK